MSKFWDFYFLDFNSLIDFYMNFLRFFDSENEYRVKQISVNHKRSQFNRFYNCGGIVE